MHVWFFGLGWGRWCWDYVYSYSKSSNAIHETFQLKSSIKIFNNIVTDIIKNNLETKNSIKHKI